MQNRRFQDFAMFLSGIRDPQKMAMQMLQNNTQSEFAQNLLKVAQTHDEKALGNIANNVFRSNGIDFASIMSIINSMSNQRR